MQVIQLVFYATEFIGVYFVNDSSVQVMAISPLLIIAFVGLTSDRAEEGWSTSVSYSSSSTAYGTGHRAQAGYGGNAASGRGIGAARGGGERFTGGHELPPIEFNVAVSFEESESEADMRFTGKAGGADEEISSAPRVMPSRDEEIEMQCMAV